MQYIKLLFVSYLRGEGVNVLNKIPSVVGQMKKYILIIFIPLLLSFAISSCKKKVIATSTTQSTGGIIMRSASSDPCFPSFGNTNFEMDYEVWGVDANMNPIFNRINESIWSFRNK